MNFLPRWYVPPHLRQHKKRTGSSVVNAVLNEFELDKETLVGVSRRRKPVRARHVAWYVMSRKCHHLSQLQMARLLGRTNHSTVTHGITLIEHLVQRDPELAALVDRVERAA